MCSLRPKFLPLSPAQDAGLIATLAVGRAVDRLDGATVRAREQVVPPRLVVRTSTAPP